MGVHAMKTKTMVVYYFSLLILLVLVLTVPGRAPRAPGGVKLCKHYASCDTASVKVQNWLDFR